jgi:hypothetical protein
LRAGFAVRFALAFGLGFARVFVADLLAAARALPPYRFSATKGRLRFGLSVINKACSAVVFFHLSPLRPNCLALDTSESLILMHGF